MPTIAVDQVVLCIRVGVVTWVTYLYLKDLRRLLKDVRQIEHAAWRAVCQVVVIGAAVCLVGLDCWWLHAQLAERLTTI